MTRTALVYIMMPGDGSPLYSGKSEFEDDLDTERVNTYVQDGARQTVRIIRILRTPRTPTLRQPCLSLR